MKRMWITPAGYKWSDWDQATRGAHTLIAGTTGSGKSVLINSLIFNLLLKSPNEVEFCLIDPKRVELSKYKKLPHVWKYCQEIGDIVSALDGVINTMESRYKKMERGYNNFTELYVIIDELADLMVTSQRVILPKLQRISQLGRACGIHLICATQAPNRRVIPAELTLNFTERICLHCASQIESRQAIGAPGGELLPRYGEALWSSCGTLENVLVPMTPSEDINSRISYWLRTKPRYKLF